MVSSLVWHHQQRPSPAPGPRSSVAIRRLRSRLPVRRATDGKATPSGQPPDGGRRKTRRSRSVRSVRSAPADRRRQFGNGRTGLRFWLLLCSSPAMWLQFHPHCTSDWTFSCSILHSKPSGHWWCARSFRGQAESGARASTGRRVGQCQCPLAFSAPRPPGRSRVVQGCSVHFGARPVAAGDPPRGGVRVMMRGPNLSWRRDCPPPSESSIWAALAGDLRHGHIVARQSPAHGAAGSGCRCGQGHHDQPQ